MSSIVLRKDALPMAARSTLLSRPLQSVGRRIVRSALSRLRHGLVDIVENGTVIASGGDRTDMTLPHLRVEVLDPRFFTSVCFGGGVGLAEAYLDGLWTCSDLAGLIHTLTVNYAALTTLETPLSRALESLDKLRYALQRNTKAGSKRNIVAHYDLSNTFFQTFLDQSMSYSCGVFRDEASVTSSPETALAESQVEKIDRACRKLALKPEHHLLEIGTGWGALAIHAARHYGCRVTTTTISDEQHALARERITRAGLQDRITLLKTDYRDLPSLPHRFDRLVSIEMIEAVGVENLNDYFRVCGEMLTPEGSFLLQAIVIRDQFFARAARRVDFLKKYIFPGSCLPSVATIMQATTRASDLRLWHSEDIGPHYVTTLKLWREKFFANITAVRSLGFDDRFIRLWEYYLAYCEGAFRARHVGDVQMLFTKPRSTLAPVDASTLAFRGHDTARWEEP